MSLLLLIYSANILVAGWVGLSSLLNPRNAAATVFANAYQYSEVIRLVGALWTAIAILSIAGLFYPEQMILVLVFQLIYKAIWLVVVAIPALVSARPIPKAVTIFFLIWVIVLPFVIPWKTLLV